MRSRGYAGDLRVPKLVYLALTSRELGRPMNIAVVAPPAAGKNRAVDAALELVPEEAVYVMTAGSDRALVYEQESFAHRVVVFGEADSIPEDGSAGTAVRSIAADNKMIYAVPEKDPKTGKYQTRRIEKLGPTGLITTSTRPLGAQMGTRMLELTVRDDEDQTRLVMRAHAASVQPGATPTVDLGPFLALQRWLTAAGERHVAVPFAERLADLMSARAVRMRRDFRQLLATIQALAFLHQCQRPRTSEGWIEATLEDYAMARELLEPVFDSLSAEAVTQVIRETVEVVRDAEEVSEAELGRRLNLSKSTVCYRVRRAVEGGWLLNHEMRKGHPARLARGAPLPDAVSALPTLEALRQVSECSKVLGGARPPLPPPAAVPAPGVDDEEVLL
jgi:hypothetical protein